MRRDSLRTKVGHSQLRFYDKQHPRCRSLVADICINIIIIIISFKITHTTMPLFLI
jgi:hypothetical protein